MTKRFSILGDSISTFEDITPRGWRVYYAGEQREKTGVRDVKDTWWMRVIEHFDGELLANTAYSGSLVEGAGFPAASSMQRVSALGGLRRGGRGSVSTLQNPDVVMVFIGINDYGWGGAHEQAKAHGNALPAIEQVRCKENAGFPGAIDDQTLMCFAEAYQSMLENIRHEFLSAEVWCVTLVPGRVRGEATSTFTYNLRGVDIDAYNEAIRQAAHQAGCKIADIASFGLEYEASDGTHPTALGMRQIASMVVAAMSGAEAHYDPGEWPLPLSPTDAWEARRPCNGGVCVNCDQAVATANPWYLVCGGQIRCSHAEFSPFL